MNLLIDIGNSRLKWSVEDKGTLIKARCSDYRQPDFLNNLRSCWQTLPMPEKIAIASVSAKSATSIVIECCKTLWPNAGMLIAHSAGDAFGVTNAYGSPEKLGVDRWLALIAARRHYVGDVCVVDCGTAITVDALRSDGRHLGGLICPGLATMKKALAFDTAELSFNTQPYRTGLAAETNAAIANGVLQAAVGLVSYVMQNFTSNYLLVLTGGDAEILAAALAMPAVVDVDLVLKGLSIYCSGEQGA
ncbi:type III pantothenate kinase [Methylomonas sp. MgM2]